MLVKDGALIEHLPSGQKRLLTKGNWIGDAAFLVNDSVAGSQSKITCSGNAKLMVWSHQELQTLCGQSETLLPALTDAVAVSMAHKGNFLHLDRSLGASVSLVEPMLTVEQMDLHAEVFPRLTASGFELLLSHGEVHHVKQGEILEFDQTLACVLSGKLVGLDDNNEVMDVVLDRYDLIGEFDLFAPERKSGFAKRLRAAEDTHFIQWAWSSLEDIEVQAPAVYTRILKSISRALILKVIDRTDVAIAN